MKIDLCEFSIIILNWNLANYTKKCIESIIKHTNNIDYEIILVDNGSTEQESLDLLSIYEKKPLIKIVKNKENLRVAGGNNSGLRIAKGKYLLMLNNDTEIFQENWYMDAIRLFRTDWKIGVIGTAGGSHNKNLVHQASFHATTEKGVQEVEYAEGWCMWLRRQIYQKLGGLDTRYYLFCEDSDYCFQAKNIGYKVVIIPHFITHFGGKTHQKKPEILKISQKSSVKLKEKWGSPPEITVSKNILCIRYEARGDVFLCLPSVRQLRKEYPTHFIHFLTLPACQEVLTREWECIDKTWIRNEKTLKLLSKIEFDIVINFQDHQKYQDDLKYLVYKQLKGGTHLLMKNTEESQRLRWKKGKKYTEIFGEIAEVTIENRLDYPLEKADYNILKQYKLQKKGYICINLESCWETRHMGRVWIEDFVLLCRGKEIIVVLLGIDTGLKNVQNCINLITMTTLAEAKVIIENSQLFLTIDSLLLHIAQSIMQPPPILTIFTATPSNYVITEKKKVEVIKSTLPCSPCFRGRCKNKTKKKCMEELSPTIVLERIEKKLKIRVEVESTPIKVDFFGSFSTFESVQKKSTKSDYNYGDQLILNQERKDIIDEKSTQVRVLTKENIREHLKTYIPNCLIIGGGGILHPCMEASGWNFPLSIPEIKELVEAGTKIIILAVGKNCDKEEWSHVCWKNMSYLLQKATLISGRDRNTVNFLYQHGTNQVYLCPDPALFTFQGMEQQNRGDDYLNIPWTPILKAGQIWEVAGRTKLDPCVLLQGTFWTQTPEHNGILTVFPGISLISPDDYLSALQGGNITLSATLHGCILSISLGIPTLLISKVERIIGFKNLFLEGFNNFPCILEWKERHLISHLLETDFSFAIEKRKQQLYTKYKVVIDKVKEIVYGKN